MSRSSTADTVLMDSIAQNLFDALPIFRKRVLHLDAIQREHGIPLSHVQVLALLNDHDSLPISELSRRLGIAKSNVTPLVDRLCSLHLAERCRDLQDRRVINVRILPEGQAKLAQIRQTLVQEVDGWADQFSTAELKSLNRALGCIIRTLGSLGE